MRPVNNIDLVNYIVTVKQTGEENLDFLVMAHSKMDAIANLAKYIPEGYACSFECEAV